MNSLTHAEVLDAAPSWSLFDLGVDVVDFLNGKTEEWRRRWCIEELCTAVTDGHLNVSFTYDVVYDLALLRKALGLLQDASTECIANALAIDNSEVGRAPYVVWNARKQLLEIRRGILNQRVIELLDSLGPDSVFSHRLSNCFEM